MGVTMKILMVNKFLYPNGGSETYIFKIGEYLNAHGHEVQFFGMEHEGRIVGNRAESYTSDMDFHGSKFSKITYPFKIIYSREARKKIRVVLDNFLPDVVHLNNINFQITPSIIYEIRDCEKKSGRHIQIVFTAHDYQWICPNHMMYIPSSGEICDRCVKKGYSNCTKYKCIHNSKIKSLLGTMEAKYYAKRKTYGMVDRIICPSQFLYNQFSRNVLLKDKLIMLHNFIDIEAASAQTISSENIPNHYVIYFGRYAAEKGIGTLLRVCKQLPEIPFVFAGSGPLEPEVNQVANIHNMNFQSGTSLKALIANANFSVYPSEWYENCPFSVMESQMYGTPVIGAHIGGIPELIMEGKTGELFESGNADELKEKIKDLWQDEARTQTYKMNCLDMPFDNVENYCEKLLRIYQK